ncbi:MAG: hypothetical protein AAB682_03020 [Patescibacteria group bacterium]
MDQDKDKLTELFSKFPGIGPRQARRFTYFLMSENRGFSEEFVRLILSVRRTVAYCKECLRLTQDSEQICKTCRDPERESTQLLLVAKDIELETILRSGSFKGKFFVLGRLLPILAKEPEREIRIQELITRIDRGITNGLKEIILAFPVTTEGDFTSQFVKDKISPLAEQHDIKITILGRGLSTGTELEYSDADTISNALKNRS